MSNYFVCMGFSDLLGRVRFDEQNGVIAISLNTENIVDTHLSLSLTQAKVLSEAIQNVIANIDISKVNKVNNFGDIQVEMGNE